MAFLGKVLIFLLLVALCIAVGTLCLLLINLARDDLKELGIIKDKDAIKDAYQRGFTTGRLLANKYPMGQYTFPIACSHCANLNSDKCYRCKEERESGFELKTNKEEEI